MGPAVGPIGRNVQHPRWTPPDARSMSITPAPSGGRWSCPQVLPSASWEAKLPLLRTFDPEVSGNSFSYEMWINSQAIVWRAEAPRVRKGRWAFVVTEVSVSKTLFAFICRIFTPTTDFRGENADIPPTYWREFCKLQVYCKSSERKSQSSWESSDNNISMRSGEAHTFLGKPSKFFFSF